MSQSIIDSRHPLYGIYRNMLNRCYRKKNHNFKHYGGKGVTVCPEWKCHYPAFAAWALKNRWQKGLEIDRLDNDGPYSPENCRITTHTENVRNSAKAKLTREDVVEIRKMLNEGMTHEAVAAHFPVSRPHIANIKAGRRWKDVK